MKILHGDNFIYALNKRSENLIFAAIEKGRGTSPECVEMVTKRLADRYNHHDELVAALENTLSAWKCVCDSQGYDWAHIKQFEDAENALNKIKDNEQ